MDTNQKPWKQSPSVAYQPPWRIPFQLDPCLGGVGFCSKRTCGLFVLPALPLSKNSPFKIPGKTSLRSYSCFLRVLFAVG